MSRRFFFGLSPLSVWSKQVCVQSLWIPHSFPLSPLICYFITLCLKKLVGWETNHLAQSTELTADTRFVPKCSITVLFLIISINFNLPIFFNHHFIMKIFKYTENLKELYRKHPYTHHWHSTINILQYFALSYISVLLTIYEFILFFVAFQSSWRHQHTSPLTLWHISLTKVEYLFPFLFLSKIYIQ